MSDAQPLKPANILNIVAMNQGRRAVTNGEPQATPLSPSRVQELFEQGHALVDTRSSAAFGAGHVAGSINVQASSSEFEQRAGWVVPDDTPIILLSESDQEARQCVWEMAFIGLDAAVAGYLEGGIGAWMGAGRPLRTVDQMDVFTLQEQLTTSQLAVLDVRTADEWHAGHIRDAGFMPYTSMARQLDRPSRLAELPFGTDERVAVTCAAGNRSSTAISLMLRHGFRNLVNVTGGMEAWANAGLPMTSPGQTESEH
jgi:hydroxyacylglutathione hydrolase